MRKKILAILLTALLLLMPLTQAFAKESEDNVDDILNYIMDTKVNEIGKSKAVELLEIARNLYKDNEDILKTISSKLDGELKERLRGKGINLDNLTQAIDKLKGENFVDETKAFIEGSNQSYKNFINGKANEIFKDSGAPLNELYRNIRDKYGSIAEFIFKLKVLDNNLKNTEIINEYIKATGNIKVSEQSEEAITKAVSSLINLESDETLSLIKAVNDYVLYKLNREDSDTLRIALRKLGYNVDEINSFEKNVTLVRDTENRKIIAKVNLVTLENAELPKKAYVVFQLMKGKTPVSSKTKVITSFGSEITEEFSVSAPNDYTVNVFVFDRNVDNSQNVVPINLAELK